MQPPLRIVIADDERPARSFLSAMLAHFDDVQLVGEAASGTEAVELIERVKPDLALLDLQMPELDGLGVVRALPRDKMPLVAFVTAYEEHAVRAFELNAIDYLLKPVEPVRLRNTLRRAHERLEHTESRGEEADRVRQTAEEIAAGSGGYLRRIPVRRRDDIIIVPVDQIAAVVADGELLHITTINKERHTITYRLKDLEARLDPEQFVRLSRSAIANIEQIHKVSPMSGGTFVVTLRNGGQLPVSRIRGRVLREEMFRL